MGSCCVNGLKGLVHAALCSCAACGETSGVPGVFNPPPYANKLHLSHAY